MIKMQLILRIFVRNTATNTQGTVKSNAKNAEKLWERKISISKIKIFLCKNTISWFDFVFSQPKLTLKSTNRK